MHQEQGSQSVESSDETDASTWKHSEALELSVLAKRRNKDDEQFRCVYQNGEKSPKGRLLITRKI